MPSLGAVCRNGDPAPWAPPEQVRHARGWPWAVGSSELGRCGEFAHEKSVRTACLCHSLPCGAREGHSSCSALWPLTHQERLSLQTPSSYSVARWPVGCGRCLAGPVCARAGMPSLGRRPAGRPRGTAVLLRQPIGECGQFHTRFPVGLGKGGRGWAEAAPSSGRAEVACTGQRGKQQLAVHEQNKELKCFVEMEAGQGSERT